MTIDYSCSQLLFNFAFLCRGVSYYKRALMGFVRSSFYVINRKLWESLEEVLDCRCLHISFYRRLISVWSFFQNYKYFFDYYQVKLCLPFVGERTSNTITKIYYDIVCVTNNWQLKLKLYIFIYICVYVGI